jgi:hypothetical protein
MARRRSPLVKSSKKNTVRRAGDRHATDRRALYFCETLETRVMLVVLHGGDVFEFFANGADYERVVVTGNTTVELVGGRVNTVTGAFSVNTMNGVITQGPDAGRVGVGFISLLPTPPAVNDTIFAMNVTQSDLTSTISTAIVPIITAALRPMEPFTGNVTLRVQPTAISAIGQGTINVTDGTGGAILGALTVNVGTQVNNDNIPIIQTNIPGGMFQTVPAGLLSSGLTVAAGNNLEAFLFGGTVTGEVNIHGSIDQFYAGWLVTGNTPGEADVGIVTFPQNFNVDGDIRNLITDGSVGSEGDAGLIRPDYVSGFDMHVGGILGQINVQGSLIGNVTVIHSSTPTALTGTAELKAITYGPGGFDPFDQGLLGGAAFLSNESFNTPQYLGMTDMNGDATVTGTLQADPPTGNNADYYAVPLLAGQTITVHLSESNVTAPALDVGVYDPDGRLIATDYNRVDITQTEEQPFQFTAAEPGVYRFAVAASGNSNFDNAVATVIGDIPYTLQLSGLGNLAASAIAVTGNLLDNESGASAVTGVTATNHITGFHAATGDFGAAEAGGDIISGFGDVLVGIYTFAADTGNIRTVEAGQIGTLTGATISSDPSVFAPFGSVGFLKASTGVLAWNVFDPAAAELTTAQASQFAIGGDYQVVAAETGTFIGDLVANGNIGTIRAFDMATTTPSYLQVNASNNPALHGTIDLIDVFNNIGTLNGGGPAITTGPGGNVRYIHVGPFGTVFRDLVFGGGQPEVTTYQAGESAVITDDSGAVVTLTPITEVAPTTGTGTGTGSTPGTPAVAFLSVTTYPIRGSGGAAIVKVESSDGLAINTTGGNAAEGAEIGTIQLDGTGTAVVNNNGIQPGNGGTTPPGSGTGSGTGVQFPGAGTPGGAPIKVAGNATKFTIPTLPVIPSLPATALPLTLTMTGSRLDTYEITGPVTPGGDGSLTPGVGQVTAITNNTSGEIVNMHLNSLGTLTTNGTLGLAQSHTASAVVGQTKTPLAEDPPFSDNPWVYPFLEPRQMVRVLGNVISISAASIANVYAGEIISGIPTGGPGVTPPIPGTGTIISGTAGNIGSINGMISGSIAAAGSIGSVTSPGFGPNGTGAVGGDGVFAVGLIGPVVSNGDFRGTLVSFTGQLGLTVNNGSIIRGEIGNYSEFDFAEARVTSGVIVTGATGSPITHPTLDMGPITVNGNGGIIGTDFNATHLNAITVNNGGFGIFDSLVGTNGPGTLVGVSAGGYGIRDGTIFGGASTGYITARGNGSSVPVTGFSSSVRQSETGAQFDAQTGGPINFLDDIDVFLGTSASTPQITGVTDTGIIEDVTVLGSRDLNSLTAYSVRGRALTATTSPTPGFTATFFTTLVSTFNIANMIGTVTVPGPVNGMVITTGRSTKYLFGGDVSNLTMTIAGPITTLQFNSNLDSNSTVTAIGPSGRIGTLIVKGNLAGTVSATNSISNIKIGGSITGTLHAKSINNVTVGGGLASGGLTVDGSINNLTFNGDLGTAGNTLTFNSNVKTIKIGGNLLANINVTGNLGQFLIGGSIITGSASTVSGIITLLKVGGDVQAGASVTAHLIKRQIIRGQTLGSIVTG